ncbi:calmodulin 5 [Brachionus plicatilis]|uniref:Calmodulin 5 n=1 Tax=Brachionus plicatilis TaxID=10195 RepID=A0A3M7T9Q4_BRAPC|nr:calmodulin 5 [Brachionus plicatilis]
MNKMAANFTKAQLIELQEIFDIFDTENSGFLNKEVNTQEIMNVLTKLGIKCEKEDFDKIFSEMDKDSSGTIEWEEYLEIMSKEFFKKLNEKQLRHCFNRFDLNGDGFLTINEIRIVLEKIGKQMTQKQLEDMIKTVSLKKTPILNLRIVAKLHVCYRDGMRTNRSSLLQKILFGMIFHGGKIVNVNGLTFEEFQKLMN